MAYTFFEEQRLYIPKDGEQHHPDNLLGYIDFSYHDDKIIQIDGVTVDEAARGKGLGAVLVKELIQKAIDEGYKIRPICPFAVAYFEKHPELQSLLTE